MVLFHAISGQGTDIFDLSHIYTVNLVEKSCRISGFLLFFSINPGYDFMHIGVQACSFEPVTLKLPLIRNPGIRDFSGKCMIRQKLYYSPYSLELREPFGTAYGTRDRTDGMLVGIVDQGLTGYGEAFVPPYYEEDQMTMAAFFERIDIVRLLEFDSIADACAYVGGLAKGNSAAKAAVDIALHDLAGKKAGKTVAEIYGAAEELFKTSYTIGYDSIDNMVKKVLAAREFATLKIKLNGENDLEVISAISSVTSQTLFVDVNQAWEDMDQALIKTNRLVGMGVRLIEQPFRRGMVQKAKVINDETGVPVIADEDVRQFSDIGKLVKCYDGFNIKLMKCGGIYEAFRMIKEARKYGMKILLGCMTESSIGVSAVAQLAGYADWCDLDGNLLIKNDTCGGIKCVDGSLRPEGRSGIGIIDDSKLQTLLAGSENRELKH